MSTGYYDVSIWEQIRSIVRWKTYQLVESINKEIPKDTSLTEFQAKDPVSFQLREVMQRRADAWVQRLYDLCCDAFKSHGKTLSPDFDRAVWAYCLQPFIMGETDSQIHDQTMGGFLNLLLCAVGSPPEKRPSLKVVQKQCCLDVRAKVYETWHDKLHHLPPRMNEAAAAMARFNAVERRAASIIHGLPPDKLALPLSSPVHSLEQPKVSPPTGAFSSVPMPPSTIAAGIDTGRKPDSKAPPPQLKADAWKNIEIGFLSDERVQIYNGAKRETLNFAEFGFEDGRSRKPNQAWETLRTLAQQRGIIRDGGATRLRWSKVEKRMEEIRKALRKHFGISADPVPFVANTGYQALFKIGCRPSFDT